VRKALAIVGGLLIAASLVVGFRPQRADLNGRTIDCPSAVASIWPDGDRAPLSPAELVEEDACEGSADGDLALASALGLAGFLACSAAFISYQQRKSRANALT
jgi:hypothetical protein